MFSYADDRMSYAGMDFYVLDFSEVMFLIDSCSSWRCRNLCIFLAQGRSAALQRFGSLLKKTLSQTQAGQKQQ